MTFAVLLNKYFWIFLEFGKQVKNSLLSSVSINMSHIYS